MVTFLDTPDIAQALVTHGTNICTTT